LALLINFKLFQAAICVLEMS